MGSKVRLTLSWVCDDLLRGPGSSLLWSFWKMVAGLPLLPKFQSRLSTPLTPFTRQSTLNEWFDLLTGPR
jgi:hypothetical protein